MAQASIRTTAEIACDHHAAACLIARYTEASSWRGRNLNTEYDASCTPSDCCTLSRKASRRFLGMVAKCACTNASNKISSGEGAGNSGKGSDWATSDFGDHNMNVAFNNCCKRPPNHQFSTALIVAPHVSMGVGG